jgi:hypothetical protein
VLSVDGKTQIFSTWVSPQDCLNVLVTQWPASLKQVTEETKTERSCNTFYDQFSAVTQWMLPPYSSGHTDQSWTQCGRQLYTAWIVKGKDYCGPSWKAVTTQNSYCKLCWLRSMVYWLLRTTLQSTCGSALTGSVSTLTTSWLFPNFFMIIVPFVLVIKIHYSRPLVSAGVLFQGTLHSGCIEFSTLKITPTYLYHMHSRSEYSYLQPHKSRLYYYHKITVVHINTVHQNSDSISCSLSQILWLLDSFFP